MSIELIILLYRYFSATPVIIFVCFWVRYYFCPIYDAMMTYLSTTGNSHRISSHALLRYFYVTFFFLISDTFLLGWGPEPTKKNKTCDILAAYFALAAFELLRGHSNRCSVGAIARICGVLLFQPLRKRLTCFAEPCLQAHRTIVQENIE